MRLRNSEVGNGTGLTTSERRTPGAEATRHVFAGPVITRGCRFRLCSRLPVPRPETTLIVALDLSQRSFA